MRAESPSRTPSGDAPVFSVVVPVYKNAASLHDVVDRLEGLQLQLTGRLEAVFVIDGSPDDSAEILRARLSQSPLTSQLISHSRNFGSFAAIRTGFLQSRGRYIAAMAADLQEPIELIEEFFVQLATGDWDIAVGTRLARKDPAVSRAVARVYWALYRKLVQKDMPAGGVDIFACTRDVADKFGELDESNSSLVGLLFWLGYRRLEIPYSRERRRDGKSAWSFNKKVRYLLDSIFSFTSLPITVILLVGILGTIASLVVAIVVLVAWALGSIPVAGYTALMLVLLFATASILFALGIVGTYVWRTFENTKRRPNSIVMRHETFG